MKRILTLLLIIIGLFILDNSIVPLFAINGYYPSLLLVFTLGYAILIDPIDALFLGIVSGLFQDVYFHGIAGGDGVHNAVHQQVGDDAGIQAARGQDDEIRLADRLHRLRQGLGLIRTQPDPADAAALLPFHLADAGFALDGVPIFKFRLQAEVGVGHRQDLACDGQHLAQPRNRLVEAGHDAVERRQEQIAKALPRQAPLGEAVAHEPGHDRLGTGQRLHTVAYVPRRQHAQILAQHAAAAG